MKPTDEETASIEKTACSHRSQEEGDTSFHAGPQRIGQEAGGVRGQCGQESLYVFVRKKCVRQGGESRIG